MFYLGLAIYGCVLAAPILVLLYTFLEFRGKRSVVMRMCLAVIRLACVLVLGLLLWFPSQ
jgi:hypothetical protein